jgi:4-hydroxybenzoate polyprenyltransferase/phosphoserine phosphatase
VSVSTAERLGAAAIDALPLCVDLDGTLVRSDTLEEAAIGAVGGDWRTLLRLGGWLRSGRARLKQELAARWSFDAARLPYNRPLLDWLRSEHARGRQIVLCTAADRRVADAVASELGLFDEVIASDGTANLRGEAKAAALVHRFGASGFVYAGNDVHDLPVWRAAAGAVVVNAPARVREAALRSDPNARVFDDRVPSWRAVLKAVRPYQWVKNGLCLVPPLAAGDLHGAGTWAATLAVAVAFCATASGIYLLNDISDIEADRASPRKSRRPFASGDLSISTGLAIAPALLLAGLALGWAAGALSALGIYLVLTLSYNARLKEMPLIDVFLLAGLYTIRLLGGGQASGHPVSQWLLAFSSFLFLSLALIKRISELKRILLAGARSAARRGYMVEDVEVLQMLGCASSFASAIVLSLYVQSGIANTLYGRPQLLWGGVALLLFWQCRLWLATARGYMHDDPIVYAARDWVSWLVFGLLALVVILAWLPA